MQRAATVAPALALTFNAFAWGVSWWPFRQLGALGLHPLWSTLIVYALAVGLITLVRPRAWGALLATPVLWWLVLAAGTTNAAFNWAVTIGDVVRVVLLFYLMPLWAVLLARWLLAERLTWRAALGVALALGGALVVLWPAGGVGWPWPRAVPGSNRRSPPSTRAGGHAARSAGSRRPSGPCPWCRRSGYSSPSRSASFRTKCQA